MDKSEQQQRQPVVGASEAQMTSAAPSYQNASMVASGDPAIAIPSSTQPAVTYSTSQHQFAYQQAQYHQQQQLQVFWANQMQEIEQTTDFKNQSLPLARIKKIMKADEDVRMISAEVPIVFAKACEMFILELTLRAWILTEENKRRTLQKNDIAAAISRADIFDFLVDIVPRDELDEGHGIPQPSLPAVGTQSDSIPYYYIPPDHRVGAPGMIMGKPGDQAAAALYASQQPRPSVAYMQWPQPTPQQQNQQSQQRHTDA